MKLSTFFWLLREFKGVLFFMFLLFMYDVDPPIVPILIHKNIKVRRNVKGKKINLKVCQVKKLTNEQISV